MVESKPECIGYGTEGLEEWYDCSWGITYICVFLCRAINSPGRHTESQRSQMNVLVLRVVCTVCFLLRNIYGELLYKLI